MSWKFSSENFPAKPMCTFITALWKPHKQQLSQLTLILNIDSIMIALYLFSSALTHHKMKKDKKGMHGQLSWKGSRSSRCATDMARHRFYSHAWFGFWSNLPQTSSRTQYVNYLSLEWTHLATSVNINNLYKIENQKTKQRKKKHGYSKLDTSWNTRQNVWKVINHVLRSHPQKWNGFVAQLKTSLINHLYNKLLCIFQPTSRMNWTGCL